MALYNFLDKYAYINPIIFTPRDNVLVARAANNQIRSVETDGQYWEMTITLAPVNVADPDGFADLLVHRTQHSSNTPFTMPCPQPSYEGHPMDSLSNGYISAPGALTNSLRIDKTPAQLSRGVGRFVKILNLAKIYQIQRVDAVTGQSGVSDVVLYPAITHGQLGVGQDNMIFHSFDMKVTYINTGTFTVRSNRTGIVTHTITVTEYLD